MRTEAFKRVCLLQDRYKDPERQVTQSLASMMRQASYEVSIHTFSTEELADFVWPDEKIDLAIVLGGDGSFLNAARLLWERNIPLMGINLGTVGFLTEWRAHELPKMLACLQAGDYRVEDRFLLQASLYQANGDCLLQTDALNEVLITRAGDPHIISIAWGVNGQQVETVAADGLLVSTPTGSTGYALAAGGAIASPELALMQVVPICPHALHHRSYLLSPDDRLELTLAQTGKKACLAIDGRVHHEMHSDMRVKVQKSPHTLQVLRFAKGSYFEPLAKKLANR